jgi:hypothetical protein
MCADDDSTIRVSDAQKFSNVLLAEFNGETLSFSYDHGRDCVVVKKNPNRKNQGEEVAYFSDKQQRKVMDEFFLELTEVRRSPRVAKAATA